MDQRVGRRSSRCSPFGTRGSHANSGFREEFESLGWIAPSKIKATREAASPVGSATRTSRKKKRGVSAAGEASAQTTTDPRWCENLNLIDPDPGCVHNSEAPRPPFRAGAKHANRAPS